MNRATSELSLRVNTPTNLLITWPPYYNPQPNLSYEADLARLKIIITNNEREAATLQERRSLCYNPYNVPT